MITRTIPTAVFEVFFEDDTSALTQVPLADQPSINYFREQTGRKDVTMYTHRETFVQKYHMTERLFINNSTEIKQRKEGTN